MPRVGVQGTLLLLVAVALYICDDGGGDKSKRSMQGWQTPWLQGPTKSKLLLQSWKHIGHVLSSASSAASSCASVPCLLLLLYSMLDPVVVICAM
jgi:hypothetical protein